ncbi:MAG: ATP synthase F1 subunit delta [Candidatus Omnitrophica bacterium]|nr:ATP synthase F1 subunit delta [Candidatus Omnitrophota bacterium]
MIKERAVISRYGEAFVKSARMKIGLADALYEIKAARSLMVKNNNFRVFLERPDIALADKSEVIETVLSFEFSDIIKNFLRLLIHNRRVNYFLDIADYIRQKYAHEGKEDVVLKTAYPLDLEVIKRIEDTLEEKLKKKFKFYIQLDSSLLGGLRAVIGNTILDGSLRGRLEDLKEQLTKIKVT